MRFSVKAQHLPPRVAARAFILNSGTGKLRADEETAAQLHGFAAGAYPVMARLKPADFVRLLAVSEITLGGALLLPVVRAAVVGAGWRGSPVACSACTPGRPACAKRTAPSPTQRGTPLAKDAWMMGIGLGLVIDDLTDRLDAKKFGRGRQCTCGRAGYTESVLAPPASTVPDTRRAGTDG